MAVEQITHELPYDDFVVANQQLGDELAAALMSSDPEDAARADRLEQLRDDLWSQNPENSRAELTSRPDTALTDHPLRIVRAPLLIDVQQ